MSGVVVWICGLPSSGKSTFARRVHASLQEKQVPSCVLDGDDVRREVFPERGYDDEDRDAFYRDLSALAALLARDGLVVLVAATAHRRFFRERAREKAPRFLEVLVDTGAEECRARDAKGLYAKGASLSQLPGAHVPFERPTAPDVIATGGHDETALERIAALLGA